MVYLQIWQFTGSVSGWAGAQEASREWVETKAERLLEPHIPLHSPYFPFRICPDANVSFPSFVAKDCPLQDPFVSLGRRSLLGPLWVSAGRTQNRA